jgi:hypothetical protein
VLTVRIVAALPQVSTFKVDWLNSDGHFGWQPIRHAYTSIVISVSLHAAILSVLVFVVGFRLRAGVLVVLVGFWALATSSYLVLIAWTFTNIYEREATPRMAMLRYEYRHLPTVTSTAQTLTREREWRELSEDILRCGFSATTGSHTARRLLWISIALPVVLTLIQIAPAFVGR